MSGSRPTATVAVVGAGVAGLAAALQLTAPPALGEGRGDLEVVVLEAASRPGGKVATIEVAGQRVDVGPDGFLARRPEALELCQELGLENCLEGVGAKGASVFARGRLRPLPEGLSLGVPTRLGPLARSGVLGPVATARVARDLLVPRPDVRGPLGDRAIGPLVARKLGRQVVDSLVDPLVGGIHAGSVADMSAAAVYPALLKAAQRRGSFMRALRRLQPPAPEAAPGASDDMLPAFFTLRGGLGTLVEALVARLRAAGVEVSTSEAVARLDPVAGQARWRLRTERRELGADGVILAVPATEAARLLTGVEDEAARLLATVGHASVSVVTLALEPSQLPGDLHGTGVLVPATARAPEDLGGDRSFLVTALSYLSAKWPSLARPDLALLRASVGRAGDSRGDHLHDDELVGRVVAEIEVLLGVRLEPRAAQVTRWPAAFPQYRVHHLSRVAGIEAALRHLPALAVAGAAYHGVGLPACIGGGRRAAEVVRSALFGTP